MNFTTSQIFGFVISITFGFALMILSRKSENKYLFPFGISITIASIIVLAILSLMCKEKYTPPPDAPQKKASSVTLSFSGGGFRALSAETGVMHGIIEQTGYQGDAATFLNKHDFISGNSGGSWFMSLIAYSPNYISVLDNPIPDSTFNYIDECKGNTEYPDSNSWWRWCGTYDSDFHKCGDYCCCDEEHKQIVPATKGTLNTTYCEDCNLETDIIIPKDFNIKKYFYNVIETASQEANKSDHDKLVSIIDMLPGIEDSVLKPLLYYLTSPWQEVVKNSVFAAADADKYTAGSNPNNLTTHLVWAGVLMRDALVTANATSSQNSKDLSIVVAATADPNCGEITTKEELISSLSKCGIAYPIIFDYDFKNKQSLLPFCPGEPIQEINFYKNKDTTFYDNKNVISTMSKSFPTSKTLVYKLASTSGAAAAVLSNYTEINEIVDNYLGSGTISKIFGGAADTAVRTVTKYLANSAIPLQIKNGTPSYFDDGAVPDNLNPTDISTNPITRLGDGAYFDNSSVAFVIRAWQQKNKNSSTTLRSIFIDGPTLDDTQNGKTLSESTSRLFGCNSDGTECGGKTYNYIDSLGSDKLDYEVLNPQIFDSKEFKNTKNVYWGTISNPETHLKISVFTLTTLDNVEIGITKGTKVELAVLTASSDAPIFTVPGSNSVSDASNYINTIAAFSKLAQDVPSGIIDRLHSASDSGGFFDPVSSISSATTITL